MSNDASIGALGNSVANVANAMVTFVATTPDDLHLSAVGNAALLGQAEDLSADTVIPFSTDIDGDPRPPGAWDIGADQH